MKLLITGGLGFIGRQLAARFLEEGSHVTIIDIPPVEQASMRHEKLRYLSADTARPGSWQNAVAGQDVIINLAGASIFSRWTEQAKEAIYNSRVLTTRNIVDAIPKKKTILLCSTSAVGYYGWRGDEMLAEDAAPGDDFLARVCRDWEGAAREAEKKGRAW
jgi:NAD dependent epimerase/dehydratase family enzyme